VCGNGGYCLHGPLCSNPALDHEYTVLPSWERILANECIVPELPNLPTNNEGELGKMADTYEILFKQSNVVVAIREENDRPTVQE